MNSPSLRLRVAGGVSGVMALVQFARRIIRPDLRVAGRGLPLWPSSAAFTVLGGLSSWLLQTSHHKY